MTRDEWLRIKRVAAAAADGPREARDAYVASACGSDPALAREVLTLLASMERAADLFENPAVAWPSALRERVQAGPSGLVSLLGSVAPDDERYARDQRLQHFNTYQVGTNFQGTERFTTLRRLGAGGMGVVYEVHDRVRDEVVALKTLHRARAADIYRLKREFRGLADVAHPNLVCLYELIVEEASCFFTMELVNGVRISEYVRAPVPGSHRAETRADADRARNVLRQLVSGVLELHRAGKLHRDIKPSNVMVTPDGRVVILDFGLTSNVVPDEPGDEPMAGTPAYLAPELYSGAVPAEASDWYAVGATMYEALTGRVAFEGSFDELRQRKMASDLPRPVEIEPGIPADLNQICEGLLRRNPSERLAGREVLDRIASSVASTSTVPQQPRRRRKPQFVGRTRQLEALRHAFARAVGRRATAVYIHGPSGIGKTTLAQHFFDELAARHEHLVILRGRCYERESVPHKALDGIVDSLSTYLSSLSLSGATSLLPGNVGALARAFPVLLRVEAIARVPRPDTDNRDPADQRRLAFSALRELLTNLAERHSLVLHIDDLHWADADSALIIETLLSPPDPPPLLIVACLRSEELVSKPFLQQLIAGNVDAGLPLEPMTESEAGEVIAALRSSETNLSEAAQRELAREAAGNPFLLEQLAHHQPVYEGSGTRETTFAQVLDDRLRSLPEQAQRFLEVLAVCGRPMAPQLVHEAAGLPGDERPLVGILRADHLLRNSGSAFRIETYHDRIREALTTRLSAGETRRIHEALISILTTEGSADAEALFEHYRGAGDVEGASRQAVRAAQKAHDVLAFDRAALWYRSALELTPQSPDAIDWKQGLAESLANAGRPHDAGESYIDAAHGAAHARQVDLQSRAADQFLVGGHIDRGLDVIRDVLGEVGIPFPRSRGAMIASFLLRRVQLRWRGLTFTPREADRMSPEELLRIDTCFAVGRGLMLVDNLLSADFHTRHLLLALEAGESYRLACALTGEIILFAGDGGPAASHIARLVDRNRKLAETVKQPYPIALCTLADGVSAFLLGEWRRGAAECDRALTMFRTQCIGASWETHCAQYFLFGSLLYQGELPEINRHLPSLLAAAREHRQLLFQTELCMRMAIAWLAADDPDAVQKQADDAMEHWSHRGFHRQHYNHVLTAMQIELYRGRAEQAWQLIAGNWASIERTLLLRIQWTRLEAYYARARCALLMAAAGRDVRKFLSIVRHDVRRVEREDMAWSNPLALTLAAAAAHIEKRSDDARQRLAASIAGFERADMTLYAAVARRRLGELTANGDGRELIRQADASMAARGVRNPVRMARLIAPGFPDEGSGMRSGKIF